MRRRLLLQFLAVFGVMSASAYNQGEYVYTPDSKYKTVTPNYVTNGDFSNQFVGWTNGSDEMATEPSTSAWRLVTEVGPNGETVAESLNSSTGNGLARIWSVDQLGGAGLYVYSYYINGGTTSANTSVSGTTNNYLNFYVNTDGTYATNTRNVGDVVAFGETWQLVSDTVQLNQGDFLVMYVDRMAEGVRLTGVSINKVDAVFDDRLLAEKKEYINTLLAGPWENKASLEDTKGILEEYYELLVGDDIDEMNGYMAELDNTIAEFLSENTASMMDYFKHWYNKTKYQKATKIGDWEFTGGRIYHCNNVYEEEDMQRVTHEMPRSFDLPNASGYVTKSWDPGKYMMKMDVMGYYMLTGTGSQYDPDLNSEVMGVKLVGNDVELNVSPLNTRHYKSHVIFFEIPEDQAGVDGNIKFGFDFTMPEDEVGKKRGGWLAFSHVDVRRIGISEERQKHLELVKRIADAQNALKVMIDSANVVAKKTDLYKWGMAQMNDSTAKGQAEYEVSLTKVDVNGKEVFVDDNVDAVYDNTLKDYMNIVRKGMQNLYGYCQPYIDLNTAVADAEKALAIPANQNGDAALKANLNALIAEAKTLSATYAVIEDNDAILAESAKYTEKTEALKNALADYLATTASLENPSNVEIVNGDFATKNYSGWTFSENISGKETFKNSPNDSYEAGNCLQVWRGNTVSPQSMLKQEVTLKYKGLYVYTATAHGFNENPGSDAGMGTFVTDLESGLTNDTIYTGDNNKMRLFFGQVGAADSVRVHSRLVEWKDKNTNYNGYVGGSYFVFVEKADEVETTYEFGFSTYGQVDGAGANTYGFGDNKISYYGDASKAMAAFKADVDAQLVEAQKVLDANQASENQGVQNAVSRLSRRLADAKALAATSPTTAKDLSALANAAAYAVEMANNVTTVASGINTVSADVVKANVANGVYNLAGVRVASDLKGLNSLAKGIYIFNGKKYVVK